MTDQATLELWAGLARVLGEQAAVAAEQGDKRQAQLALELCAMAGDFVNTRCDETFRELVDA